MYRPFFITSIYVFLYMFFYYFIGSCMLFLFSPSHNFILPCVSFFFVRAFPRVANFSLFTSYIALDCLRPYLSASSWNRPQEMSARPIICRQLPNLDNRYLLLYTLMFIIRQFFRLENVLSVSLYIYF